MFEGDVWGEALEGRGKGFMNAPFTRHNDADSLSEGGQGIQKFPAPRAFPAARKGVEGERLGSPSKGSILADENRCF